MSGEYWSVDIPGLTEEQARALEGRLSEEFEFGVIVGSPRDFLTRHFDVETVHVLVRSLDAALGAGGLTVADTIGAESLLDDFATWLQQADG